MCKFVSGFECLIVNDGGGNHIDFALYVQGGGGVGLNEFVGLLVTMYRCIGVVMTICMRVAWVLVYVGREGGGS